MDGIIVLQGNLETHSCGPVYQIPHVSHVSKINVTKRRVCRSYKERGPSVCDNECPTV